MLVSCILPTTSQRRHWIPLAIELFKAQGFPDRELIIGGDVGILDAPGIAQGIMYDPKIRFIEVANLNIGAKRNALNRFARGEWIAHWDDDDWYAPWRLLAQMTALKSTGALLAANRSLVFYDVPRGQFWCYQMLPSTAGGICSTMIYHRSIWERHPFPDLKTGEDTQWCDAHRTEAIAPSIEVCIASSHDGNTCKRIYEPPCWTRLDEYRPPVAAAGWLGALASKLKVQSDG